MGPNTLGKPLWLTAFVFPDCSPVLSTSRSTLYFHVSKERTGSGVVLYSFELRTQQRQMDLDEFETNLVYIVSSRPDRATQ